MRCRIALVAAVLLAGCGLGQVSGSDGSAGAGDDLTSKSGQVESISWDGFVYVDPSASDDQVFAAVQRQVKSFLGAGRALEVELQDRAAMHLDRTRFVREHLTVAGSGQAIDRVRYHYADTALVSKSKDPGAAFGTTLMFGDYVSNVASYLGNCVDEQTDGDSLWYHWSPELSSCQSAIAAEQATLSNAAQSLQPGQLAQAELGRRYLPIRVQLAPQSASPVECPEYDRLLGFGSDRSKVVVYAFFGVEHDEADPADWGLIEYLRFIRTIRARWPNCNVTYTEPSAMLLDFWVDGQKLDGVTYEEVADWIIDGTNYPPQVGSDPAKIADLKNQVRDRFSERWIYFTQPITVSRDGQTRQMTVELRTWHGWEDTTDERKQHAEWRYLEAFWYGDVFAYAGHSHFGHGPLEPTNYNGWNFPTDRYQVMLINSCLSFNYYDVDFLQMHPGGSQNLDVVVNGLPAYWEYMGQSTANYVLGLVEGQKRWADLLGSMQTPDPLGSSSPYDPMRAVNGELDNHFDPSQGAIGVTAN